MRTWLPRIGYLALGLLLLFVLASTAWALVSWSVRDGDYGMVMFGAGALLLIAALIFLFILRPRVSFETLDGRTSVKFGFDRTQHGERPHDFHPWKPWKMPYTTTRRALWLRAGLVALLPVAILFWLNLRLGLGAPLVTASVLLVAIPLEYWRLRRQYEPVQNADDTSVHLRYRGPSKTSWRETLPVVILAVIALVIVTGLGIWLID